MRTLDKDGKLCESGTSFRELIVFIKKKPGGLLNKLFWPDDLLLVESDVQVGELSAGMLRLGDRSFGCISKRLSADIDYAAPTLQVCMEEGSDWPVFQRISHASSAPKNRFAAQFIRSVPNSRIWARGKGFVILDADRKLLAQLVIDDEELKCPEPGIALIHLDAGLTPTLAEELVATFVTLKFAK